MSTMPIRSLDPVRTVRRIVSPSKPHRARHWCESCQVYIEPKMDSQGPHCPWCQSNVLSPMERKISGT